VALETAAFLNSGGHEAPLWFGPETGPEGSLLTEARALGVPVRIIPDLRRAPHPWRDLQTVRYLEAAFRREQPDWVHTHSSKAGILGREAARRAGVPRIAHTVHGWGFTPATAPLMRRLYLTLERREARGTTRMIFVSQTDRMQAEQLAIIPPGSGVVIPPGINLTPFREVEPQRALRERTRRDLGIDPAVVVGGFLGRLAPQKDPETALRVAEILAPSHPRLHWILIGDGPLGPALRRRADANPGLAGRLHWTGLTGNPVPFMAAMDFLLFPSRWEGLPLTLMEAMAAGLPVVATDLPAVRALLDPQNPSPSTGHHPSSGRLVPAGDSDAFAAAASALIRDEAGRQDLGQAARTYALAQFGIERMLERLLAIYEST
jgi:glycosyltransferase involved in cell wall biosynthesis